MPHIAIIGGGITGLSAAFFLQQRDNARVTLIERAPICGGKITTTREDGFVIEGGPDSFLIQKPAALELCRALGLENELIPTNQSLRRVFVWSRGQLRLVPSGISLIAPTQWKPFLTSSLFSWRGKARIAMEMIIPPRRDDSDESLASFVRRRFGREAFERLGEPMMAGIFVGDAETLSLQSTFPQLREMELKHGSLIRGARFRIPQTRTSGFLSLCKGMQQLSDALTARLKNSIQTNRSVERITRLENEYQLTVNDGSPLRADAVIFATPAFETARLLAPLDSTLADQLNAIQYVSSASISLGFRRADVPHPLNGFGFIVPHRENRKILACTWTSSKFAHRAPSEHVLLRAFVGGAHDSALAEQDDDTLIDLVRRELHDLMQLAAEPILTRVSHWHKANPQYLVGHKTRVAELEQRLQQYPNLLVAGSAYSGGGLPDCISSAARAVNQLFP
ncbi:MAG TPA: protoporphyrinogen oxidase [Anaerolineae bacterium]|nr:protoporphyrinogen oxidase [Anaerolineae bacterium]